MVVCAVGLPGSGHDGDRDRSNPDLGRVAAEQSMAGSEARGDSHSASVLFCDEKVDPPVGEKHLCVIVKHAGGDALQDSVVGHFNRQPRIVILSAAKDLGPHSLYSEILRLRLRMTSW